MLMRPIRLVVALALLLAVLALTACLGSSQSRLPWAGPGFGRLLVSISAQGFADRATQALPPGVGKIEIKVSPAGGPASAEFEPKVVSVGDAQFDAGTPVEVPAVPAGKALITVKVLDKAGKALGQASKEVDIGVDTTTTVNLSVSLRESGIDSDAIERVRVSTASVEINSMPEYPAGAEDDLVATVVATADVVMTSGEVRSDLRLIWSTTDPNLVTVVDGTLRTQRDAREGTASIVVSSVDAPGKTATISVTVTRLGGLDLGVR